MNKIIIPIIVIVVAIPLIAGFFLISTNETVNVEEIEDVEKEEAEVKQVEEIGEEVVEVKQVEEPKSTPSQQTGLGFNVNVSGGTQHGDKLTIFGTVSDKPRHLTGMIYKDKGIDVKILYIFQIQLDDTMNEFSKVVLVNEDYLWEEDTTYIVSVNHGEIIKKIEFYRGTAENNFLDSIVPLV